MSKTICLERINKPKAIAALFDRIDKMLNYRRVDRIALTDKEFDKIKKAAPERVRPAINNEFIYNRCEIYRQKG